MDSIRDEIEYSAFISYSHSDKAVAHQLAQLIERYVAPGSLTIPAPVRNENHANRFKRVFRDELELGLTNQLSESLKSALGKSEYLIIICSPACVSSSWVEEEINYFISLGRREKIITVISGGEPNVAVKGLASELECYPDAIRRNYIKTNHENSFIDLLGLDLRNRNLVSLRYREPPLGKLIARLLDLKLDDYQQRQKVEETRRRRMLFLSGLFLAFVFLSISSVALLMYQRANLQKALNRTLSDNARIQAIAAIEKQSILLANQASLIADPAIAALIAIEAWNIAPPENPSTIESGSLENIDSKLDEAINADNWEARLEIIESIGGIGQFGPRHSDAATQLRNQFIKSREINYKRFEAGFASVAFNSTSTLVAIGYESGRYYIASMNSEDFRSYRINDKEVVKLFFTHDDSRLIVVAPQRIEVVDIETMKVTMSKAFTDKDIGRAVLSWDSAKIALGSWDGEVSVIELENIEIIGNITLGKFRPGLAWMPNGDLLVGQGNAVYKFNGGNIEKNSEKMLVTEEDVRDIKYEPSGKTVSIIEDNSGVRILGSQFKPHEKSGLRLKLEGSPKSMSIAEVRDDHDRLYVRGDGGVAVWEISSAKNIKTLKCGEAWINDIKSSPKHQLIAAINSDGGICVWDTRDFQPVWLGHEIEFTIQYAHFINEATLATFSNQGSLQIWDLQERAPVDKVESCGKQVDHIVYSPKGDYLFASTCRYGFCRWSLSTLDGSKIPDFRISNEFYPFEKNGETFLVTDKYGKVHRVSTKELTVVEETDHRKLGFRDIGYNVGGSLIVGHRPDKEIFVWDARSGFQKEPLILGTKFDVAPSMWMAPDDLEFVFLHDHIGRGYVFDGSTGRLLMTLAASSPVNSMEPLGESRNLVVVLDDGRSFQLPFERLQMGKGEELDIQKEKRFEPITLPGNWFLMPFLTRDSAVLFDPAGMSVAFKYDLRTSFPGRASYLRVSPDGKTMAATYAENITSARDVLIWRLPEIISRKHHPRSEPDIKELKNMSMDRAELLRQFWAIESEKWTYDFVSTRIHRCLDPNERRKLKLSVDPPCWCGNKSYPPRAEWRSALGYDPFIDKRGNGTSCNQQN